MKKVEVFVVNAFVKNESGGNPAGVVINCVNLTSEEKQEIAKRVGLSETTFVNTIPEGGYTVEFFTPNRQIAHCGHATIAAFSYLHSQGFIDDGITFKETIDGRRDIHLFNGVPFMEQLSPKYEFSQSWSTVSEYEICKSLGLRNTDLYHKFTPTVVSTGNRFLLISVGSTQVLKTLSPCFDSISRVSEELDLIGYYLFSTDTSNVTIDANTRMFAPRYSINEEAATGMAAGPLACSLFDYLNINKKVYRIEQGSLMTPPSRSEIEVRLNIKNGQIVNLLVGGSGKHMSSRIIKLQ